MDLLIRNEGPVCVVTLNRPEIHNALSLKMIDDLSDALADAERAGGSCFVITNAGEQTFCSGGNLVEFGELRSRDGAVDMSLRMQRFARAMRRSPLIVIAAMNGGAYGGGLEFALGADVRVASESARFGFVQIKLAITPAWRGISRALEAIPRSKAILLMTTGERFDAGAALAWNLVDRLAPRNEVLASALAIANTISAHSPLAVRTIKRMIDAPPGDADEDLAREAASFVEAWISDAHWEALDARLGLAKPLDNN